MENYQKHLDSIENGASGDAQPDDGNDFVIKNFPFLEYFAPEGKNMILFKVY